MGHVRSVMDFDLQLESIGRQYSLGLRAGGLGG